MGYKIIIKASARKELSRLDKSAQRRIAAFIDKLQSLDNPRKDGIAMQGQDRLWRYRIGDYRMIVEIDDKAITVIVFRIGHRREVYR